MVFDCVLWCTCGVGGEEPVIPTSDRDDGIISRLIVSLMHNAV